MIWFTLVLCAAVTYRAGRFVVLDELIREPRDAFLNRLTTVELGDGSRPVLVHEAEWERLSVWRRKLYQLLTCPHCITAWISGGATVVADQYAVVPLPWFFWLGAWSGGLVIWAIVDSE